MNSAEPDFIVIDTDHPDCDRCNQLVKYAVSLARCLGTTSIRHVRDGHGVTVRRTV